MNSSLKTIFMICNTMVGSVTLVIPINFLDCGLILSIIIMSFIGIVSLITCIWVV